MSAEPIAGFLQQFLGDREIDQGGVDVLWPR
jgi:hypothetical protein